LISSTSLSILCLYLLLHCIPATIIPRLDPLALSAFHDPFPCRSSHPLNIGSSLPLFFQVKTLEYTNIYNPLLPPGDRARGKCITVINRSEVVGRPLAALLANDGARVLSADITGIIEYSKRPTLSKFSNSSAAAASTEGVTDSMKDLSTTTTATSAPYGAKTSHVTTPVSLTLKEAIAISDVVVSAVPGGKFKVETDWLKDGVVCVDIAGEKNFEADVTNKASIYIPAVGKLTIA
jgi:methylenetetrahydrofolate dehydrogenase (NAD+)